MWSLGSNVRSQYVHPTIASLHVDPVTNLRGRLVVKSTQADSTLTGHAIEGTPLTRIASFLGDLNASSTCGLLLLLRRVPVNDVEVRAFYTQEVRINRTRAVRPLHRLRDHTSFTKEVTESVLTHKRRRTRLTLSRSPSRWISAVWTSRTEELVLFQLALGDALG